MRTTARFAFRRVTRADFDLLGRWLADPEVRRWWNHDPSPEAVEADFGPTADGLEPGKDFIATLDGEPVGLVQFSFFADYPQDVTAMEPVAPLGDGAATIDYLIGDARHRGHGTGTAMIAAFTEDVWHHEPAATHLVVPVSSANVASWRALQKAGFRVVARGELEPDNPAEGRAHEVLRLDRPRSVSAP